VEEGEDVDSSWGSLVCTPVIVAMVGFALVAVAARVRLLCCMLRMSVG